MFQTFFQKVLQLSRGFVMTVKQATGQTTSRSRPQARRIVSQQRYDASRVQTIVRRHRPDYQIVMYMILLMMVGLVLIYAIGPQRVNLLNRSFGSNQLRQTHFFYKQLVSLALALVAFVAAARVPLDLIKKHTLHILLAGLAAGLLLFISSKLKLPLAHCTLGACRWLNFGVVTVQVSEVIKLSLVIFFAVFWKFFSDQSTLNKLPNLFCSFIIFAIATLMIAVWQNDLGTSISMILILLAMFWSAGIKPQIMLIIFMIGIASAAGFVMVKPHRVSRVMTFLRGDDTQITDETRHIIQAKIAIGSGGVFGLGIGKSVQATGYLPEAINDSIFAIVGEVFGFVGCIIIIGLFVALVMRLLQDAATSHDTFNRLLITGAAAWVFSHFVINVTSMLGIMPMTGIALPFLSYGGTSMLFVALALGLAFNASQFTAHSIYVLRSKK